MLKGEVCEEVTTIVRNRTKVKIMEYDVKNLTISWRDGMIQEVGGADTLFRRLMVFTTNL